MRKSHFNFGGKFEFRWWLSYYSCIFDSYLAAQTRLNHFNKADNKCYLGAYCPNIYLYTVLEGTCSGEHGIGMGKKNILLSQFGNDGIKAMKLVKTALDPLNIMNPGKILD